MSACGGGGGGGSRPSPLPPPPPAPPPSPPPSSSNFDDAEYRRSDYAVAARAIGAYDRGATGRGAKIAIIDSGIASDSPEFAGRIDPASTGLSDDDGHGTAVAMIAAGARNGVGTLGIAFDATLLSIDTLTCGPGDCFHRLADVAAAIDYSVVHGADVINLSQVGPNSSPAVVAAVDRATRAGTVVVIAAGNGGAPDPDGFALANAQGGANGALIIAGAYAGSALISSQAGAGRDWFLAAPGGSTSASTPVISGAAALLAVAFPNLTGSQIVDILFSSADDAGAPGVDAVWGHGILNITRAFQPAGTTSFVGRDSKLAAGTSSGPLGDFARREGPRAIVLDRYSRAYAADIAGTVSAVQIDRPLGQAAAMFSTRSATAASGAFELSVTRPLRWGGRHPFASAEPSRLHSGLVSFTPSQRTQVSLASGAQAHTVRGRLAGNSDDAFIAATDAADAGLRLAASSSVAVRQVIGGVAVTASAERGRIVAGRGEAEQFSSIDAMAHIQLGKTRFTLGAGRLVEAETVLGARLGEAVGNVGATTRFATAQARVPLSRSTTVSASYRHGWTAVHGGSGFARGGRLQSDAFAFDLATAGPARAGDRFAVRLARPLRVSTGGLTLTLPTGYDYASGQARFTDQRLNLVPIGRALDLEAAYGLPLFGGHLNLNAYVRKDPGNVAAGKADWGALLRFAAFR